MEKQQVLRRQEKNAHKTPGHRALKDGRAKLPGCYSEKTGKTYDAMVLLEDDGNRANYKMVLTMADLRA
jgi:DNA topoisomerase-3